MCVQVTDTDITQKVKKKKKLFDRRPEVNPEYGDVDGLLSSCLSSFRIVL